MQRKVTYKAASATLTYAEMGDVVVNSDSDVTITLPAPNKGLWFCVSNVGTGIVTVYYESALTTLKQTEQALMLANGTSGYWMSKGWAGSEYTLPQATETALGGIKAKARTTETAEAAIDTSTGKLYVPGAGEAANGLPAGGTAGQMLSKVDETDYNAQWADAPSGWDVTASEVSIEDSGEHFTSENVEGALSELFTSVSDGKASLITDVESKGGTVTQSGSYPTFEEIGDGILSIPSGGGGEFIDLGGSEFVDLSILALSSIDKPE